MALYTLISVIMLIPNPRFLKDRISFIKMAMRNGKISIMQFHAALKINQGLLLQAISCILLVVITMSSDW